jgi:hypothetical protein
LITSNHFLFFSLCKPFNYDPWAGIYSIPVHQQLVLLSLRNIIWKFINHITLHRLLVESVRFKIFFDVIKNIIFFPSFIQLVWPFALGLAGVVCISCTKVFEYLGILLSCLNFLHDLLALVVLLEILVSAFYFCKGLIYYL